LPKILHPHSSEVFSFRITRKQTRNAEHLQIREREREREREEGTEKVTEHKNPRLLLAHLKTLPKSKSRILKRERERERERAASIKDGSVGKVDEVGSG